ncbi:MAG: hypothetical protein GXO91_06180, partial [FCB group bacterium]|nr:hypothetical protein [FCB group bacterium]
MFKRVFLTISLLMAVTLAQEYTPVISYDLNPDPNLEFATSDMGITVQQDFGEFDTDLFRVTTEGGYFDFTGLAVNDVVGNGSSVFTDGGCDEAYAQGPGGWGAGYTCNATFDTELEIVVRLSSFPPPGDPNDYINCDIVIIKSNNPTYFIGMQPAGLVARNRDVVRTIVGVQVDVAYAAGGDPGATTQGYTSLVNLTSLFHNPPAGDMMVTADFFPEVGPNITDVQYIPISYIDCNGVLDGLAVIDDCGECVDGDTGLTFNYAMDDCGVCFGGNADMDCAGVCFGTAIIDDCGSCVEGTTGLAYNYGVDCNGDCFGGAIVDDCGDCTEGSTGMTYNGAQDACGVCYGSNTDDGSGFITGPDADCAGVCFGESTIDDCGDCVLPADFNAAMDCNGDCYGTAFLDDCEVCSEGLTGHAANSDQDCAGVCFGESTIDDCGDCVLPADFNGAMDCNDECYGTAFIDDCGICAEGSTGLTANVDDGTGFVTGPDADCNGDCFGTAYVDDCGICAEGNTGLAANIDDGTGFVTGPDAD